ncbi:uncharacterized protein L969DRAFT_88555 [Mixia osmundae IAM 14324]|nr:uncharacterized protein L969DRAFT_88555 [Mixia osmundae IAM 14324]KEI39104.1 hypothetical protein L969DRAFT_88555 [Mixia osmundae IAM 14324]
MGVDKFENEDLIKHAWPEDVWFHVDKVSSAHVYLRMPGEAIALPDATSVTPAAVAPALAAKPGTQRGGKSTRGTARPAMPRPSTVPHTTRKMTLQTIPSQYLIDAAQLVKANSIQGSKMKDLIIIYTPASNLLKTNGMEVGSVSFTNERLVRRVHVADKDRDIVSRLEKTRTIRQVDFQAENVQRIRAARLKALEAKQSQSKSATLQAQEAAEIERIRKEKLEQDYAQMEEAMAKAEIQKRKAKEARRAKGEEVESEDESASEDGFW